MDRRSFTARLAGALAALTAGLRLEHRPRPTRAVVPHQVITDLTGIGLAGEDLQAGDLVTIGADGRYYRSVAT